MIAAYEAETRDVLLSAPRQYGLTQQHKHLREMQAISGLKNAPLFCPIVGDFYSGMEVTVMLSADMVNGTAEEIKRIYQDIYREGLVSYRDAADENGFLSAAAFSGRDDMEVSVYGNDDRILLTARYDNLGKGASGSAVQNMNAVLGLDSATGLKL